MNWVTFFLMTFIGMLALTLILQRFSAAPNRAA
jgi:hypothetical protein